MAIKFSRKNNTTNAPTDNQYMENVQSQQQKEKIIERLRRYDKQFTKAKMRQTYFLSALGVIALSFAFQFIHIVKKPFPLEFKLIPIICVSLAFVYVIPRIMLALAEDKYEENKFQETTSYIEQMLYSFRRNSKILNSLKDTLLLFPEGEMHDAIEEAIHHIQTSMSEGNVYEEALDIIEEKYECRRIKSLHRYLVQVEGVGGDHDMGIHALINDRRLWMDRIDEFKKEKKSIIKEVIISTIFSSVVSIITLYMLPSYVEAPVHPVIQGYATFYIIANLFNIKATITRLILRINDITDEEHDKAMVRKLNWYKNYNLHTERRKAIPVALIGVFIAAVGLFTSTWIALGMGAFIAIFSYFIQPRTKYRNTKKAIMNEIEIVFPDWLLELALLLQTDNFHVALEKTIDTSPLIIREELQKLSDAIIINPTEVEPFMEFFNYLPLGNIHSSMKLLYSIGEFGSLDEQKQIAELIERNAVLMNKAEEYKNQARLSRVFMLKFVPMGTSAVKMIVDMGVFLIIFISQSLSVV